MKQVKRLVAMLLCLVMMVGLLPTVFAEETTPQPNSDAEWAEIQGIISQYYGEWKDTTYPGKVNSRIPNTALLGNGDVGVSSAGNDTTKTFMISKSDFWEYNGNPVNKGYGSPMLIGTYSISEGIVAPAEEEEGKGENLARHPKNVTCSSEYNDVNGTQKLFAAKDAVDGVINKNSNGDGWVSNPEPKPDWFALEYEKEITFQRFVVYNDGYIRPSEAANNTKNFEVQVKDSAEADWRTVVTVTGNTKDVVDVSLDTPVTAKFVRMLINDPGGRGDRARIVEFELYKKPAAGEEEEVVETNPDVIKGATVYACGEFTDGSTTHAAANMVDGVVDETKWCCVPSTNHRGTNTHWAIFDMGVAKTFSYYKLTNAGLIENNHNTRSYQLQYLETTEDLNEDQLKASEWKTILEVKDNDATYPSDSFNPVTARYVRLYLTEADQPNQNNAARIHELELYATDPTPYFRERENILDAQVETDMTFGGQLVSMKTWMAATDNVMVTELTVQGNEAVNLKLDLAGSAANVSLRPVTAAINEDGSITVTRTTALNSSNMPQTDSDAVYNKDFVKSIPYQSQAAVTTKVVGAESTSGLSGTTATLGFTLEPGKTVYLVTAIGGGGQTYDADGNLWTGRTKPVDEAAALLAKYKSESDLEALHAVHLNWWKDYWMQSYISLDTSNEDLATIQKYYYAAQYMLGSAIREGNVASGLYGIWHTNDSPSWHSDFHLNYNFIATYYGMATSNRVSMLLPAAKALTDYFEQGKANAASMQQLKVVDNRNLILDRLIKLEQVDAEKGIENAILYPVSIGPYGMTLENNSYHNETVNAPYSIYPLIEYYNYTLDEDFLRESLYPYLELVNNFAIHWLVEDEPGKYNLYAGYNEGSWAINPAVELSAYKNCLRYGVKFSKQLGDNNWEAWEPVLNGLADQPTVANYNGTGKTVLALAEKQWNGSAYVEMTTPVPGDGNCIPLDALLPGEVFGYYSSNETLQILQDTVKIFDDRGGWTQINNFPRLATDAVNCRYSAERVVGQLAAGIRRQMKANMMIDDGVHGIEKAGATEAVNNMMLLSDQGVIKLFGNWLANTDAKFVRLRANGAFVFSAEYDGAANEIKEGATMTSEKGATATVATLWADGMTVKDSEGNIVPLTKGTAPNHEDEVVYTFDTKAGETYTFTKGEAEIPVTGVTLDKTELTLNVGGNETLSATVAPENATNKTVTWTSSDETVATVDASGKVTALKAGTTTITVTTEDGGKTATCTVTVNAKEAPKPSKPTTPAEPAKPETKRPFIDVKTNDWYDEAISYVYENGLMNGTSRNEFSPNAGTTRGMIVTILYRQVGTPNVTSDKATWWSDARVWAMENGISDGTNMNGAITREQLAAMLYRYAQKIGAGTNKSSDLAKFNDASNVSSYAVEAMQWAVANGIISGRGNNMLAPKAGATRAETAAMLMRFIENIVK